MARIVFFELEDWEKEYIGKELLGQDILFTNDKLNEKNVAEFKDAEIISTFIYSNLNKSVLDNFENLKFIATRSTGFDHIDINCCKEKEIIVSNVPVYGKHSVAEHTFALILSISRRIAKSIEKTRRGDFSINDLKGFDLYGKTIGIIGFGKIGERVAQLALCFGMKVLVYTKHPESNNNIKSENLSFVSLETLLESSDIVSLHVPYNKETHHLINLQNINLFKKGSVLINTSRGPLIDTQAILYGLEKEILQGVGLDVLEEECFLKEERELLTEDFLKSCNLKTQLLNHVLLTKDNVIITPHNAFNSQESLLEILKTSIENIKTFLNGVPSNKVW